MEKLFSSTTSARTSFNSQKTELTSMKMRIFQSTQTGNIASNFHTMNESLMWGGFARVRHLQIQASLHPCLHLISQRSRLSLRRTTESTSLTKRLQYSKTCLSCRIKPGWKFEVLCCLTKQFSSPRMPTFTTWLKRKLNNHHWKIRRSVQPEFLWVSILLNHDRYWLELCLIASWWFQKINTFWSKAHSCLNLCSLDILAQSRNQQSTT